MAHLLQPKHRVLPAYLKSLEEAMLLISLPRSFLLMMMLMGWFPHYLYPLWALRNKISLYYLP